MKHNFPQICVFINENCDVCLCVKIKNIHNTKKIFRKIKFKFKFEVK